jgi:stearoyl-CoA desaturase (delta-9 desaturase)
MPPIESPIVVATTIDAANDAVLAAPIGALMLPAGVMPFRPDWPNIVLIGGYHLAAAAAFLPMYFSWSGLILAIVLAQVTGVLGINLCYHRLLTHRGLQCPRWLEHALVVLAILCLQDTPARWVAVHRRHHQHSDEQPDPHSPLANVLWAHMGWLFVRHPELWRLGIYERYAKDILRDPFYAALERGQAQIKINLAQLPVLFALGFGFDWWLEGTTATSVQSGISLVLFGAFARTVIVWHQTWAVNSIAHVWGYRNYDTAENSRNNLLVGLLANGEGWHNNHHADPRSARHGHRWWEIDTTFLMVRIMMMLGLARNVVLPSVHLNRDRQSSLRTRDTCSDE